MSYRHNSPNNKPRPDDEELKTKCLRLRKLLAKAAETGHWLSEQEMMADGLGHRFGAAVHQIRRGNMVEGGDDGIPMAVDCEMIDGRYKYLWRPYRPDEPLPPPPFRPLEVIAEITAELIGVKIKLIEAAARIETMKRDGWYPKTQLELLK